MDDAYSFTDRISFIAFVESCCERLHRVHANYPSGSLESEAIEVGAKALLYLIGDDRFAKYLQCDELTPSQQNHVAKLENCDPE